MRRSVLPSVLVASAIGIAYLIIAPDTQDLAAAVFRSDLFSRSGFVIVNEAWYGGHHVPAYSLLMPPLGSWLGPRLLAALAAVAAAWLFALLAEAAFPRRRSDGTVVGPSRGAWLGAIWFAAAVAAQLFTGRVAFLLGLPIGLGALLAAQRERPRLAIALAVVTALASPVDAAFLALAGVAWTAGTGRRFGAGLAAAALTPVALMTTIFPEGGSEPFVSSAFWPALAALLAFAMMLPREERVLRAGAVLYAAAVVACFVIPTAVGGNVTRLAALIGGPVAACVAWPRRRALVLVAALPLLYWQLMPPIRDVAVTQGDPSTREAYYAPLIEQLRRHDGPLRIEVPFTRTHWEAALLAPHVALARGWERQLDRKRNALFYDGRPLTQERYLAWLHENAIDYVALPDVALDDSAKAEARLLRRGVPGLRVVWSNAHWVLYAVQPATPPGVSALSSSGFTLRAAPMGSQTVRVRFSPHWAVVAGTGCVGPTPDGFTRVRVTSPGTVRIATRVDPTRALLDPGGERCTPAVTTR